MVSRLAVVCSFGLALAGPALPQVEPPPRLTVRVTAGDGAINSIRLGRAHDPAVQILDPGGEPLEGASVTFLLPATGAGGNFGADGLSLTVQTDRHGMAATHGLRPNQVAGPFQIRVTASWRGTAGSGAIAQTNAEPVLKAKHTKMIAILVIVAGAAAGGAAVAASGGKSSANQTATTGGTTSSGGSISAGSPSVGPPH